MQNSTVMTWTYRLLDNPQAMSNLQLLAVMGVVAVVLACILAAVVIADKRRQREQKPKRDGDRNAVNSIPCNIRVVEIADEVRAELRSKL